MSIDPGQEGPPDAPRDAEPAPQKTVPDYAVSIDHLRWWAPNGPWTVTAIEPDSKGIATLTFMPGEEREMLAWLEQQGTTRNLYFSVNPVRHPLDKKSARVDIASLSWLHVDLDPRAGEDLAAEQVRLRELALAPPGLPPPSLVAFSGGGFAAYWQLRTPLVLDGTLAAAEDASRWNIRIEQLLGGDSCHNIDRIMRLPGSVNRPNAKKRKRGQDEALAVVVERHADRVYDLADFPTPPSTPPRTSPAPDPNPAAAPAITSVDDLPASLPHLCKAAIQHGHDPDDPTRWSSRSEALFYVCCELVRHDWSDPAIHGVITTPAFGISASVLEQGRRSDAYARRQIERARALGEDFDRAKNGNPKPSASNVRKAIVKLGAGMHFDEFLREVVVEGLPGYGPTMDDVTGNHLWLEIGERFEVVVSKDRFWIIARDFALRDRRHPVRDYLDSLEWDRVCRLDSLLPEYFGAEASDYNSAVGRLVMIAAVRRVRQPGCKFDEMLILEGPQGYGKSTALAILSVNSEWFSDDLPLGAETKAVIEATSGKWIVEAGELKGLRVRAGITWQLAHAEADAGVSV